VLKQDPDWALLPPDCPPAIRRLLRRCLARDRTERLSEIGTARLDIRDAVSDTAAAANTSSPAVPVPHRARWVRLAGQLTVLLLGSALAGAFVWYLREPGPSRSSQFLIVPPPGASVTALTADRELVLSQDGRRIVYVGNNATELFVRDMAALEPRALPDLGVPRGPFLSPDGEWVGFFDGKDSVLKKVAATGGPPLVLGRFTGVRAGATWGDDGTIVFATREPSAGLWTLPEGGGEPVAITTPDAATGEEDHVWPEFLPGRSAVLFTILSTKGGLQAAQIAIRDVRTGAQKILLRGGTHARYVASGHLLYAVGGTLFAVPFDPDNWTIAGAPRPVLSDVVTTATGAANFDVSSDGTLVYVPATLDELNTDERRLVWVSRDGREEATAAQPRAYNLPRLSPDGTRVALQIDGPENGIWIFDFARETLSRATQVGGPNRAPVWTPEGHLIFESTFQGRIRLVMQPADSSPRTEHLLESRGTGLIPFSVSNDGATLIFGNGLAGLMRLSLRGERTATTLIESGTGRLNTNAVISPDGRWLAYDSADSGTQRDVYVRPLPDVNAGRWQVSGAGGSRPLWARDGRELFYVSATGALMRVSVSPGTAWSPGKPERVLERVYLVGTTPGRTYDVSPDGQRFLMVTANQTDQQSLADGELRRSEAGIVVFTNWFEEVKRLVPVN
jgi:serine/threonine-protein kinase